MEAVEFIKERNRMCDYYNEQGCCKDDEQCPALRCKCDAFRTVVEDDFKLVEIVKKWSSEHPRKTMLQDFLEKFPKAKMDNDGTPSLCPDNLGYCCEDYCSIRHSDGVPACVECWNRPLEG